MKNDQWILLANFNIYNYILMKNNQWILRSCILHGYKFYIKKNVKIL